MKTTTATTTTQKILTFPSAHLGFVNGGTEQYIPDTWYIDYTHSRQDKTPAAAGIVMVALDVGHSGFLIPRVCVWCVVVTATKQQNSMYNVFVFSAFCLAGLSGLGLSRSSEAEFVVSSTWYSYMQCKKMRRNNNLRRVHADKHTSPTLHSTCSHSVWLLVSVLLAKTTPESITKT